MQPWRSLRWGQRRLLLPFPSVERKWAQIAVHCAIHGDDGQQKMMMKPLRMLLVQLFSECVEGASLRGIDKNGEEEEDGGARAEGRKGLA